MMFETNPNSSAVVERIPIDSVGAEIGVWRGDSSEKFIAKAGHLHMVDPWSVEAYRESSEHGGFTKYLERYGELVGVSREDAFQVYYDAVYAGVLERFKDKPVTIHRMTSTEYFATAEPVDWVYIDGSHSFDGCLSDLLQAVPITRYAIFGDDYGSKQGVTRAVKSFIEGSDFELEVFGKCQYMIRM